ncbi:CKLF-like MARVEL transmembrane domain-containing protein 2 isoform X1 [Callorhinus ursinus]|uniref:CKLF-like MARVEL transmembrane domain-containing protein 2 isoform X1 n=1 Tax=Callorhinus ursinus TaxID=34884 RepID=A0A3Q7QFW0_CALUR|nr:CKLF-like MARVEL transmembrane domain-containing protein 2 isoform X1 [Callorhinus ursinus]
MADKGKKGKAAAPAPAAAPPAPAAAPPAPAAAPPPPPASSDPKPQDKKDQGPKKKEKSVQPKDEVGMRKGCRRYKWELKDSNKEFWVMGHAEVKILSLQGCLIAALVMFTGTTVHPLLTLIITMELSVFCFFFIIYTFAINRYMPFILWPISDLLNDLFAFIFLVGAVVIAVRSRQTMPMHYFIAVILIGVAGLFALIDICLQRKHFKGKRVKRNVLIPPAGKEQKLDKPKEGEKPPENVPEKAGEKPKDKGKGGKK